MKNKRTEILSEALKRAAPVAALLALLVIIMLSDTPERRAARAEAENGETFLGLSEADSYPMTASVFALDTFCTITLYEGGGGEALREAASLLRAYDALLDPSLENSDISRINERSTERVEIAAETAELLDFTKAFSARTGGAFDITVGNLTALWDFKKRTVPPEETEVLKALRTLDADGFRIERAEQEETPAASSDTEAARFYFYTENDRLKLDVGALAKGYIADQLKEALLQNGVISAVINLGGNVLCVGALSDTEPFQIGLKKPERAAAEDFAVLAVDDRSVVTAGTYERYFEADGVRYHHILDTKTGYPVQNGLSAVSVIGESSALCDALSTTLFIKGTEDGLSFLENFNAALKNGNAEPESTPDETEAAQAKKAASAAQAEATEASYYAFFIGEDGTVTASPGATSLVTKTAPGYVISELGERAEM